MVGVIDERGVDERNDGMGEEIEGKKKEIIKEIEKIKRSKDIYKKMKRIIKEMMMERGIKEGERDKGLIKRLQNND